MEFKFKIIKKWVLVWKSCEGKWIYNSQWKRTIYNGNFHHDTFTQRLNKNTGELSRTSAHYKRAYDWFICNLLKTDQSYHVYGA